MNSRLSFKLRTSTIKHGSGDSNDALDMYWSIAAPSLYNQDKLQEIAVCCHSGNASEAHFMLLALDNSASQNKLPSQAGK